jgi:hypothetical protein
MAVPSNYNWEIIPVEGLYIIFFVGVAILSVVIYYIAKGEFHITQRYTKEIITLTREETPAGFWMIVGVFFVFGLFLVIASSYYILIK